MKTTLKHYLYRTGLFQFLDSIRYLPAAVCWVRNGCSGNAPPPIKRQIILSYLQKFEIKNFIETGTHLGDTLDHISRKCRIKCTSIELSDHFFRHAQLRFKHNPYVSLYHADSSNILPELVSALKNPALFWLDGHYSVGKTAKGQIETPISEELNAVLQSNIREHVILIDDARCFDGSKGYPELHELLAEIHASSNYKVEVSADIIRLTPQ